MHPCRAPAAGEVQAASVALAKQWGKLQEQWVVAEMRASEQFFSRTFEPMPRAASSRKGAARAPVQASCVPLRGAGCGGGARIGLRRPLRVLAPLLSGLLAGV